MIDRTTGYDRAAARFSRRVASMSGGMALAFLATIGVWGALFWTLPALSGVADPPSRMALAWKCTAVAVLLCFLTGIEAVSHERLQTDAFDPLAGHDSQRLKINARYLQNTLEQLLLFIPGLFGLALYLREDWAAKAVLATTAIWILTRWAFWIGYHLGPQYRVFGLTGMLQSLLVLLFVAGRFGYDLAGVAGASAPVALFAIIELFLVWATRRRAPRGGRS